MGKQADLSTTSDFSVKQHKMGEMAKKQRVSPDTIKIRNAIKEWINGIYNEWRQGKTQKEASARNFAAYLGIKESNVTAWMRGEMGMSGDHAIPLANRFGPELYKVLGWELPECYQKKPSGQ